MAEILIEEIKKFGKSPIFINFFGFVVIMLASSVTSINGIVVYNNRQRYSFCDNFYFFANDSDIFGTTVDFPIHADPFEKCCQVCYENPMCKIISRSDSACYFKNETNVFYRKNSKLYYKNTILLSPPLPNFPPFPSFPPMPMPPSFPNPFERLKMQCLNTFLCDTQTTLIETQSSNIIGLPIVATSITRSFDLVIDSIIHSITFSKETQRSWTITSSTIQFCTNPLANKKAILIEDISVYDVYCKNSQNWNGQQILIDTDDTSNNIFNIGARIQDRNFQFLVQYDDFTYKLKFFEIQFD